MKRQDARTETIAGAEALSVLEGVRDLYVMKGKKIVHLDVAHERPDDDALSDLLLGPTGNLRAPTVRVGSILLVGFEPDTYGKVIGI